MGKEFIVASEPENRSLLAATSMLYLYEKDEGSFDGWVCSAKDEIEKRFGKDCRPSCLLFSADPVTIGHRYILEIAAKRSKALVVFVLEEISTVNGNGNPEINHFAMPFETRLEMTKTVAEDLDNVLILPSGPFFISRDSISGDLLPDKSKKARAHADLFYTFFFERVCKALDISCVFAGDEPRDEFEEAALNVLRQKGSACKIPVRIAERKRMDEKYVCSSLARDAINSRDEDAVRLYIPECVRKKFPAALTLSCC